MAKHQASRILVSFKFSLLLLEAILTILTLVVRYENVAVGMRPNFVAYINDTSTSYYKEWAAANDLILAFGILSIIFQVAQIAIGMLALTIHFDKTNSVLCIWHFIGLGCYLFFLFDRWHYRIMMYIWLVFALPPLLLEIISAVIGYYYLGIAESRKNRQIMELKIKEANAKRLADELKLQREREALNAQENEPLNNDPIFQQ